MEFKEYKIEKFIEDLSSDMPSPGGGNVAALTAALSASLNSMVYSLTLNKKSFDKLDEEAQKLVLDCKEFSSRFTKKALRFMDEDREAFMKLMEAYKLKKDSEEEKKIRNTKILEGTVKAMDVPLKLTKEAYKFYDYIDVAVDYGNKMLASDAGCAAILLHAAIESSIINVKVNLNSLREKKMAIAIEEEINNIAKKSLMRKEDICKKVNDIIYPNE